MYEELVRRSRERALLISYLEVLSWDELTYMPRGGAEHRGRQMAYLAGWHHEMLVDERVGELLTAVQSSSLCSDPSSAASVNVRQWRRMYERMTRLPRGLVEEFAHVATSAQQAWVTARQNNDFQELRPWLEKVVHLARRQAECLAQGGPPYDALLEEYEPGVTATDLTRLFAALRPELTRLLAAIAGRPRRTSDAVLRRDYTIDRQRVFIESVAAEIGFDFERGRLDSTSHPFFSPVGPGDCRITTRYNARDFGEAFFALLHELGHGLYEQGLDEEHHGTPLGDSSSLGIHESQSRLWENAIGRSLPFWRRFFPRAREIFHDALHDVKLQDFYLAVNHVEPGCNRVRADEASYDLHILARFELEQALINGELSPGDLPAAWNDKYREHLGVDPPDDAEGCLQDSHWAAGQFGYFPTYTLGNIYAAQFMESVRTALPELDDLMAQGNFTPLVAWLREQIYRHGQRYQPAEHVTVVTGRPPDHQPLINSLWQKLGEVYEL
jgi:carboxypeptidase Taq